LKSTKPFWASIPKLWRNNKEGIPIKIIQIINFIFHIQNFYLMNQILSKETRKLIGAVLLMCAFFVVSATNARAQQTAHGTANPYASVAQKLNVTAYPLGSISQTSASATLHQITAPLKQQIQDGTATAQMKFKYAYCTQMLSDIDNGHIAVEITLLTSLEQTSGAVGSIPVSDKVAIYNEIAAALQ
jgi:hypothetical protein